MSHVNIYFTLLLYNQPQEVTGHGQNLTEKLVLEYAGDCLGGYLTVRGHGRHQMVGGC